MRKVLPLIAVVLSGVIILSDYVLRLPWLHDLAIRLLEGGLILVGFALLLGTLNLLAYHLNRIRMKASDWWQSWIILVSLPASLLLGLLLPASAPLGWIYRYVITPIQATMGALLVFYAVNSAARLLVLRSSAAIILFLSSIIFLILWIPFISGLSPIIPAVSNWLTAVPLGAGMRGILMGMAIGAIIASLRILFTLDHPYTGHLEKR